MNNRTSYPSNSLSIGGSNYGMAAVGEQVTQTGTIGSIPATGSENQAALITKLDELLARLDPEIQSAVPEEKKAAAQERVDELKNTLKSGKPDLSTMEYVRNWFINNAPKAAGAITGLIVHPLVGKLVELAGEALTIEFRRRFGTGQAE